MYISRLAFVLAALSAASCIDKDVDNTEFYEKYARGFDNRTTVAVGLASEVAGEYYAVYFGNPYDGESLVKQPALTGFTPVSTTLDVPKDVERLYVVAQGEIKPQVGNLSISAAARPGPQTRAADVNPVSARVMTAVNSIYFPEKTNNVRGDDLFKCTDLVIDRTPSSAISTRRRNWLTFLGDGGCRQSQLFGKLWFYTYPSSKQDGLTPGDCTFYGVKDGEVVAIPYSGPGAAQLGFLHPGGVLVEYRLLQALQTGRIPQGVEPRIRLHRQQHGQQQPVPSSPPSLNKHACRIIR